MTTQKIGIKLSQLQSEILRDLVSKGEMDDVVAINTNIVNADCRIHRREAILNILKIGQEQASKVLYSYTIA